MPTTVVGAFVSLAVACKQAGKFPGLRSVRVRVRV